MATTMANFIPLTAVQKAQRALLLDPILLLLGVLTLIHSSESGMGQGSEGASSTGEAPLLA